MKPGPSLNTARRMHGCASLSNGSIIVVGGQSNDHRFLISTEILKVGDLEWSKGPDLKEAVYCHEFESYDLFEVTENISLQDYSHSDIVLKEYIDVIKVHPKFIDSMLTGTNGNLLAA